MENGFIDPLYTTLGTTVNYNAIANLHNLQIITVPLNLFQPGVSLSAVSWQQLHILKNVQLHAIMVYLQCLSSGTTFSTDN
jgi:hypothetical protein